MRALVVVTGDPSGDVLHDGDLRGEEWLIGDTCRFRQWPLPVPTFNLSIFRWVTTQKEEIRPNTT